MWEYEDPMTVHGNGGYLTNHAKSYIKNYGEVWFQKRAITKIVFIKVIWRNLRIIYDSASGINFIVHNPNGVNVHFSMRKDGMHYHDTNHRQMNLLQTVNQTFEGFSQNQIHNAKIARSFQAKFGHPSTHDLKAIISTNHIINFHVTASSIDYTKTIFVPRLPILKGKTTHQAPETVISYYVDVQPNILQANKNFTLFGDILFVIQILFFVTVSDHLKITTAKHIHTCKIAKTSTDIQHVKSIYSDYGFNVTTTLMDGKSVPLKHTFASNGNNLNTMAFK